jgi:CTP:phosphocholine cytidylyltransferase-like protein
MTNRNAVIMAAGTSSRFVPLSQERPKGLLEVQGEILIERQIRQLREAGISDITVVTGYKAEMFHYLQDKFGVSVVMNEDYARYNNTSSVVRILDRLGNTYLCSSDNYFTKNVFAEDPQESYYSALYADGETSEYCIVTDATGSIKEVRIGGRDSWYMVGHAYFTQSFSAIFSKILRDEYTRPETRRQYWEDVYIRHIDVLPMKINKYEAGDVFEFDTLDELRLFDKSYVTDTRSSVIKAICRQTGWKESDLHDFKKADRSCQPLTFSFSVGERCYIYDSLAKESITEI